MEEEKSWFDRTTEKYGEFWGGVLRAAFSTSHTNPLDVIAAMFILAVTLFVIIGMAGFLYIFISS